MRIIAGEFRSRRIESPPEGSTTRPIPDRVRESVFGLLRGHFEDGARVFDAFAGTGVIGLEAISRGAAWCVFVEKDRRVGKVLRRNIASLGVEDRCEVFEGDALGAGALARCPRPVDVAFFDPPYALARDALGWRRLRAQLEQMVERLADDGFLVLRTPWPLTSAEEDHLRPSERHDVDLTLAGAEGPETHVYRGTAVHLYMRRRGEA